MMKEAEVRQIAEQVNDISMDYHLTHAVFACEKLLEKTFKEYGQKNISELKEDLQLALRRKNKPEIERLLGEIYSLQFAKFHIFVDYVDNMATDAGRVIKAGNNLIISLPKQLVANSKNDDGSYKPEALKKLREVMAHELGHIILHIKDILRIDGLQGSKELDEEQEQEANWFANELLRLRLERNKKLFDSENR
ncbi:hypothetical protein FACS1894164_14330 [Spirochaetia bacterium]|nr:hypothetical protein FACS1894164_14330 [Spirochaetia bacterium]